MTNYDRVLWLRVLSTTLLLLFNIELVDFSFASNFSNTVTFRSTNLDNYSDGFLNYTASVLWVALPSLLALKISLLKVVYINKPGFLSPCDYLSILPIGLFWWSWIILTFKSYLIVDLLFGNPDMVVCSNWFG